MFLKVFKCCSFCLLPLCIPHGTAFSDSHLTASFLEVGALLSDVGTRMLTVAVSLVVIDVLGVKIPGNIMFDLRLFPGYIYIYSSCTPNPGHSIECLQCSPCIRRLCQAYGPIALWIIIMRASLIDPLALN